MVIYRFHRERTPLAFQELHDRISGKGLADIFNDILYNTVEQVKVRDVVPFRYIAGDNRIINALDDLIGRTLIKIAQCNDRKATHADIFGKQFFRGASACFFELHILGK